MMKAKEFQKFELALLRKEKIDIRRNFRIVEALHKEALALCVFPPKNPLDGFDVDLRIAKVINCVPKTA
ncbi:MAG: hypothetical protein KG012_11660 [Deltaproteobacteria bacterium]|nr:hypothetical protein [Deltaproteobacteria bacterium]